MRLWSKQAGGHTVTATDPSKPPQHESPIEERIPTMDYAVTRVRTGGALLSPRSRWGLVDTTVFSPAAKEVFRLYRHLEEVFAIATAQLEECARWHRSDKPALG
jgi:hypothetical protein